MGKRILTVFGLLDAISVFTYCFSLKSSFFYMLKLISGISGMSDVSILFFLIEIVRFLFLISLIFSAVYLMSQKKIGCIISYIQFPFRIAFATFSLDFLAHLNYFVRNQSFYLGIMLFCMIVEIGRLILTAIIHREFFTARKKLGIERLNNI